jgi:hypothetical protein
MPFFSFMFEIRGKVNVCLFINAKLKERRKVFGKIL